MTGDFADDPDTSATEQYKENIKFIDERVQSGALTSAAAAEAKRLALRQLLKLPLNEKDRQNPVQTYLEHQAAIQEAIKSGAITQEEADRMQQSTKEQLFPIDTDDNKYIEDFEDVKNAYMQMGDTPEAAEEKAEKYLKDKLTEKGTGFERINQKVSQITDPKIRQYARQSVFKGIAGRTLPYVLEGFVDNFLEAQMGTLPEEAIYDAFGEMWLTYTKDKLAPQRRQAADMFQNMYRKLVELKEETGITTGRVTSGLFSQMTREELSRAATEWTFELIRPEGGLTPAQESKIAEVHAYITSEFKKFLLMLSGTAASDQEVAFVRSMYPNIFMSEEVNLGIIAGNIQVLHDNELAHFTEESDPEFAQKVMQARRWHTVIKPKTKKKRVHVQPGDDEWEEIKRKTAENAEKW